MSGMNIMRSCTTYVAHADEPTMTERSAVNSTNDADQTLALRSDDHPDQNSADPQPNIAYPIDTSAEITRLLGRYSKAKKAIPVSFRRLVPWLKVGERATHYIHPYPAKLLPHIAHFFLASEKLCPKQGIVLDPFGGSGTVALEACLAGRVAAYTDTNPLARLIAATKVWHPGDTDFEAVFTDLHSRYRKSRATTHPNVINISKWFDPTVIRGLSRLRAAIEAETDHNIKQFLHTTFSATVRRVSNADLRLSVPVLRKSREEIINPNFVWDRFEEQFRSNARRAIALKSMLTSRPEVYVAGSDARNLTLELGGNLEDASIDLVITSPPYAGAQKYIRASSLSLGWLNLAGQGQLKPLENKTIGREHLPRDVVEDGVITSVPAANRVIQRIRKKNPTRAAICATYLNEMEAVFSQISRVLKPSGKLVLVIGNNEVCGEKFLSSNYLSEQLAQLGFILSLKMVDEIKSRGLMTKRNKTASVITREWVLVFEKN